MLIQTRYLAPTNHKGSRVKAWAIGRSFPPIIVGYFETSGDAHEHAAETFAASVDPEQKNARFGQFYRAGIAHDDKGYIFAPVSPEHIPGAFTSK